MLRRARRAALHYWPLFSMDAVLEFVIFTRKFRLYSTQQDGNPTVLQAQALFHLVKEGFEPDEPGEPVTWLQEGDGDQVTGTAS